MEQTPGEYITIAEGARGVVRVIRMIASARRLAQLVAAIPLHGRLVSLVGARMVHPARLAIATGREPRRRTCSRRPRALRLSDCPLPRSLSGYLQAPTPSRRWGLLRKRGDVTMGTKSLIGGAGAVATAFVLLATVSLPTRPPAPVSAQEGFASIEKQVREFTLAERAHLHRPRAARGTGLFIQHRGERRRRGRRDRNDRHRPRLRAHGVQGDAARRHDGLREGEGRPRRRRSGLGGPARRAARRDISPTRRRSPCSKTAFKAAQEEAGKLRRLERLHAGPRGSGRQRPERGDARRLHGLPLQSPLEQARALGVDGRRTG